MLVIPLKRYSENRFIRGTVGVIDLLGLVTLELPWHSNQSHISCIPDGEYLCEPEDNKHLGPVWRLKDVPDRSGILIHKGNKLSEILGCILVGDSLVCAKTNKPSGDFEWEIAGGHSQPGFDRLKNYVGREKPWKLSINR